MAIWITVTVEDKDAGEILASKEFLVNFADPRPSVWFANAQNWAASVLVERADDEQVKVQEDILTARKAALAESKAAKAAALEAEASVEAEAPKP